MIRNTRRFFSAIVLTAAWGLLGQAQAGPVQIDITSVSFTPGTGYGVDKSEKEKDGATLLDVLFSTVKFVPQSFSLDVNESHSFLFGTVNLRELDAHGGILESETDNLGVTAQFQFTNPFGDIVQLVATGEAITGSVSDKAVDLTIKWNPLQYAFGDGGLLWITLGDLSFSTQGSLDQVATVALRASPRAPSNDVPEPTSLALVGIAVLGLGVARRRRR